MLKETLKHDIRRYIATDELRTLSDYLMFFFFNETFWFVLNFRIGQWVRTHFRVPLLTTFVKIITFIIGKILSLITGYQIPFSVLIGDGLYIGHSGLLIINGNVRIGNNCNLSAGVVIGQGGRDANKGSPIIGDNVYIAPGAKIFGHIRIGNNVAIGANAVVTRDVPDNAVVVGVPAKVINYNGSKEFIRY